MSIAAFSGDIITCPNDDCGIQIAIINRNIYKGSPLNADLFDGINKPIRNGDRPICPMCGISWFGKNEGGIHTQQRGWKFAYEVN